MKIIIDTEIVHSSGLRMCDFYLLLAARELSSLPDSQSNCLSFLKDNNLIASEKMLTKNGLDFVDDILNSSSNKESDNIDNLVEQLQALWPSGYKDGKYRWKSNKTDIKRKLEKFFRIYGKYSNEQILKAANKYVEKFNQSGNRTYQKLLKYFIFKEDGSDSDLANALESLNENETELCDIYSNQDNSASLF